MNKQNPQVDKSQIDKNILQTNKKLNKKEKETLHKHFKFCGNNSLEWRRKCEMMLPKIVQEKIWKQKGFGSVYEYAAKLAGMSKSSVGDALWVMRKIEDKPALKQVAKEKGLGRVRPVANIATQETAEFWARKARDMSRNVLRTFTREMKKQEKENAIDSTANNKQTNKPNSWAGPKAQPEKRLEISVNLKANVAKKLEQLKKRKNFEELFEEFLDFVEEKDNKEKPEAVKTDKRYIPVKIKKHVLDKTGGKCAFPGCCKPAKNLHHTQRFALNKTHDPDQIVPLCTEHERLAHLGLIENEEGPPETWKICKNTKLNTTEEIHKHYIDQLVWLYR